MKRVSSLRFLSFSEHSPLAFQVAAVLMYPDESPIFIAMIGVVPVVSLVVLLARKGSSRESHE